MAQKVKHLEEATAAALHKIRIKHKDWKRPATATLQNCWKTCLARVSFKLRADGHTQQSYLVPHFTKLRFFNLLLCAETGQLSMYGNRIGTGLNEDTFLPLPTKISEKMVRFLTSLRLLF